MSQTPHRLTPSAFAEIKQGRTICPQFRFGIMGKNRRVRARDEPELKHKYSGPGAGSMKEIQKRESALIESLGNLREGHLDPGMEPIVEVPEMERAVIRKLRVVFVDAQAGSDGSLDIRVVGRHVVRRVHGP